MYLRRREREPWPERQQKLACVRRLAWACGIEGTMNRKGDCLDNAVVESSVSLKSERLH